MACFVSEGAQELFNSSPIGASAYAAHLASLHPVNRAAYRCEWPADPGDGPNMSMLEADCMELPVRSAVGIHASPLSQGVPPTWLDLEGFIPHEVPRPMMFQIDKSKPSHEYMRDAFHDPKSELLQFIETARNESCGQCLIQS